MRTRRVLLMVLVLALIAVPVLANDCLIPAWLENEVYNGDFETQNLNGWTQGTHGFTIYDATGYAIVLNDGQFKGTMYQILDETQFNGWLPDGTFKNWWFKFDYQAPDASQAWAAVYYYDGNPGAAPAFGGIDNPGAGWVELYNALLPSNTHDWVTVCQSGTIEDFQPRWIAIALAGQQGSDTDYCMAPGFDNIEFYGECVPVPPSAVLLGSGLLGLLGFGWRRMKG